MTIIDYLQKNAQLYKNDVALVEIDSCKNNKDDIGEIQKSVKYTMVRRSLTWNNFYRMSCSITSFLILKGYKKGDKAAILLKNCIEWLPIYFGILNAGMIAVPLSCLYSINELTYCIETTDVSVVFYGEEFVEIINTVYRENQNFVLCAVEKDNCSYIEQDVLGKCANGLSFPELEEADNAAIYFSSGTTGMPKAVLLSHGNLLASATTEYKHHQQTKEDVFLCIPPFYHTGVKMHWFGSLLSGGKAVILRKVNPLWILQTIQNEGVTNAWLLVPWVQDILCELDSGSICIDQFKLSSWHLMHMGAQPISPAILMHWMQYFYWQKIDICYGLTEATGPGVIRLGEENLNRWGSVGKPGYGWKVKIVDENNKITAVGVIGEIAVCGPGIMIGYYKNQEETNKVLKDGWLFTGDMGYKDEDGFIFIVGRKKDIIIVGGECVSAVKIENYLNGFYKVKDSAVIGILHNRYGEAVKAIVELKDGVMSSEKEILDFCKALPKYERPVSVVFDHIIRNETGKIDKKILKMKYGGAI